MIVSTISEKVDKEDAVSLESVTIKDEPGLTLPSSRAYSVTSEPPAYEKRTSSSVKIARLIAVTVVAVALILGAAIIAAAYIQSMNSNKNTATNGALSTETNVVATIKKVEDIPTAHHLTGDEEKHINNVDHDDSSTEDDESKDHNRMDTEPDLLEEFLENEGKILRLPTGFDDLTDLDRDIDELTKMFMARNPLDKNKCVVERKPIEGDLIRTLPITAKNASAVPLFPIISGERISIICSSSEEDDSDFDVDDGGIIPARPIMMPILGMRPPVNSMAGLLGPMGSPFQLNSLSHLNNGPIPSIMMPPPAFRSIAARPMPHPFGVSPPWMNINNDLAAEQRSMNSFLNAPPPFLRPPFQQQQQQQPQRAIRFPVEPSIGQQFQQFQQFPTPFQRHNPVMTANSQEKSHVPEQRITSPPIVQKPQQPRPVFRLPQLNPTVPELPESLIRLLEDLPDMDQSVKQPIRPARIDNANPLPIFRVAVAPSAPPPRLHPASSTPASPRAIPIPNRPIPMPFLNFPIRPPMPEAERREGPSFFERLIHSLLGGEEYNNNNKNNSRPNAKISMIDSMPVESRTPIAPPAIRTGSRAMREPMDVPSGVIVARPIEAEDHQPVIVGVAPAVGEDRVARSHFIQPRSVEAH